jgi:hypothetical protein
LQWKGLWVLCLSHLAFCGFCAYLSHMLVGYFSIRLAVLWILCLWHLSFLYPVLIILVILWVMSLSHLPFCGFYVCHTEFYGFHSCHTCWFVGSVSFTHNCIGCIHIILVGLWVLCPSHISVWIPSLSCWVCGFCISQNFVGSVHACHTCYFVSSVSVTHNCMGLMPITLVGLWVQCFGVIIFWYLTILWVLCLLHLPFCGFYAIVYTLLCQIMSTCQV